MTDRPTATHMAITQRFDDGTRNLHFATDKGPVVVNIGAASLMLEFGELIVEEAEEWEKEDA